MIEETEQGMIEETKIGGGGGGEPKGKKWME